MPNLTPEEWEFIKWGTYNEAYVYIENDYHSLTLVQPHQNPFYGVILAAHGPVHEPTEEELAREAVLQTKANRYRNIQGLRYLLGRFAYAVDNPSHWNRLNPERKAEYAAHYRNVVKLRNHKDMAKPESIVPWHQKNRI